MPVVVRFDENYPKELNTLGDHLRKRRLDLGLLQQDVAQQLGVTAGTVWQWERNRKEPETRSLPAVIAFLGYQPIPPSHSFPEALRTLRRAAGLSQEQLAQRARIDESTIAKWERGKTLPFPATFECLGRYFKKIGRPLPEFGPEALYGPERRQEAARRAWRGRKKRLPSSVQSSKRRPAAPR